MIPQLIEHGEVHMVKEADLRQELRRLFGDENSYTKATHPELVMRPGQHRLIKIRILKPKKRGKRQTFEKITKPLAAIPFSEFDASSLLHTTYDCFLIDRQTHNGKNVANTVLQALRNCHNKKPKGE